MAKFSFTDAANEEPRATAADGNDKRKHDGGRGPGDGATGGGPAPKARKLAAAGDGRDAQRVGGDGDAGISTRIDPNLLDYFVCFEPLCPPLYQVYRTPGGKYGYKYSADEILMRYWQAYAQP